MSSTRTGEWRGSPPDKAQCPRCTGPLESGGVCPRCLLSEGSSPFDLLEEIGRGGMGTVWRARHRGLDRLVAVKYLSDALSDRPEFVARFLQEAKVMARLHHPRIVTVYDVGTEEGLPYIVMEHVPGPALATLLPLPPARAIEVCMGVCEALAYAHAHGVVHRDVKPENILIDDAGEVKVADFGIARVLDTPGATATGAVIGTPAYLSPEALAGARPDPRMDLYAVGAVLYQCITGRLPAGVLETLEPALDAVIRRALAPADRRFASASELRDALSAARTALRTTPSNALTPEDQLLQRVAALALTAATGTVIAAILVSVTPRVIARDDVRPLVMIGLEPLPDGRFVSRARFEEGPLLAAVGALAVGAGVWALILRHWRKDGLLSHLPDRPVPESRWLLGAGALALGVGAARQLFLRPDAAVAPFVPLLGGGMELVCLALLWSGLLEARRTGRTLRQEWMLFAGMGIALLPPIHATWEWLTTWRP